MVLIDMDMPEDCFDCKKVYKKGCALYDRSNVRIGKRHPDCPLRSADEMIAELYKEADLMTDREGEDCMAILIDDAIEIIHKYCDKE